MNQSIWATPGNENSKTRRPGDWSCSSCGFSNFQRRRDCLKCSKGEGSPPKTLSGPKVPNQSHQLDSLAKKPALPTLADSLWAPRDFSGRAKKADTSQVWRKKLSQGVDASQSSARVPQLSTTLDLGLPYEVQHFILSMMQRIIEEGCYDFAYRWMRSTLNEKGWRCPEAVELSAWRDFLPSAVLQLQALDDLPQHTLLQGLREAVQIRNAAVHRHLCSNIEIQRMAEQAEKLMSVFQDGARQHKFFKLWEELNYWDRKQNDPHTARERLEKALLEINERPMDDMDWTPNAVSLQEITTPVEVAQDTVDYDDAMEID